MTSLDDLAAKFGASVAMAEPAAPPSSGPSKSEAALDALAAKYGGVSAPAPAPGPAPQTMQDAGPTAQDLAPPGYVPTGAPNAAAAPGAMVSGGGSQLPVGSLDLPAPDQILPALGQNLGVAARGAVQGATGLVTMVADPLTHLLNLVLPDNMKQLPPSQGLEHVLTMLGVPEAHTQAQQILQATTAGMTGAATSMGAGEAMAAPRGLAPTTTVQRVGQALAENPTQQLKAGAGSGAGAQVAANAAGAAGANPAVQQLAALAGSVAGGTLGANPGAAEASAGVKPGESTAAPGAATEGVPRTPEPGEPLPAGAEPAPPSETAPKGTTASPQDAEFVGHIIRQASDGNKAAQAKLADIAQINPDAKAAAQRIGMDLPPDVLSDNPQIREAAGLARSKASSEASADWINTLKGSMDKADDAVKGFDAVFVGDRPSLSTVSDNVKQTLMQASGDLKDQTSKVYDQVNSAIPAPSKIQAPNTVALLDKMAANVGGVENLPADLRKLYTQFGGGVEKAPDLSDLPPSLQKAIAANDTGAPSQSGPTYGLLMQKKAEIGQDLAGAMNKAPLFPTVDSRALGQLYDAVRLDQRQAIDSLGDPELSQKLRAADVLYAQKKGVDDRIVSLFGPDGSGNLERSLTSALSADARSKSTGDFATILSQIPDNLKKEAVATTLASITRSSRGLDAGGFGFSEYAKAFPQLRAHPQTYKAIVEALGPGSHEVLRDLYTVSKRITDARSMVYGTGKSLQNPMVQSIQSQTLMAKFLNSTIGRAAVTGAGSSIGSVAGPFGAMAGAAASNAVANALANGSRDALSKAGKLFSDPKFQTLILNTADKQAARAVANSPQFAAYAKSIGIPPAQRWDWLVNSIITARQAKTGDQQ